jgi:phosphoserine phosphatase RsbU/P
MAYLGCVGPEGRKRVLVVDDSATTRALLERTLRFAGYDPIPTSCGSEALAILEAADRPLLAVVDWMLPDIEGPELCARIRLEVDRKYVYILLLTARTERQDVVHALEAGADDFVRKPFDAEELASRLRVGERILALQDGLQKRVTELQGALDHVRKLQGIVPICMYCKRIRDDADAWHQIESYLSEHIDAQFSHGLCSDCLVKHHPPEEHTGP